VKFVLSNVGYFVCVSSADCGLCCHTMSNAWSVKVMSSSLWQNCEKATLCTLSDGYLVLAGVDFNGSEWDCSC